MARVRERLLPGRYQAAAFVGIPLKDEAWQPRARQDFICHAPMEVVIGRDGGFFLSMEGASAPGAHAFNCAEGPMQGAIWVILSQMLVYDGKVNDGSYLALRHYFPLGTWCNAGDPQLAYCTSWAFLIPAFTGLCRCLSRALFARGYREEVVCGYGFTGDAIQGGGVLAFNGEYWPAANFEMSAVGLGASAVHDGLDWGYAMWNPESDQGDAELWELLEIGIPYLARRVKANTAGYGKYRGGSGWEAVRVLVGNRDAELYMGRGDGLTFMGCGIFGGYPQATSYRLWSRGSELMNRASKGQPYPLGDDPDSGEFEELVGGEITRRATAMMLPEIFHDRDVLHYVLSGGPGCGDPLERPGQRVVDDMNEGIFSERIAGDVFGVVASRDEKQGKWMLDEEATDGRRQEIRRLRAERSLPYEEFWRQERQRIEERQLGEPVRRMFRESMSLSQAWGQEFRAFWKLPEGFEP
jgi:N-methylhydantoinase B/acetone carboxylase alpha subunit